MSDEPHRLQPFTRSAKSPSAARATKLGQMTIERGIMTSHRTYYANRLLEGLDHDPARSVVRLSVVHYISATDVTRAIVALDEVLA